MLDWKRWDFILDEKRFADLEKEGAFAPSLIRKYIKRQLQGCPVLLQEVHGS